MDTIWNHAAGPSGGLRGGTPRALGEPPLSPPPAGGMSTPPPMPALRVAEPSRAREPDRPLHVAAPPAPIPAAVPDPAAPAPPSAPPSLEALLLRFRLIAPAQLDEAQRASAESGRDIGEIIVERGWMSGDQLERIRSYAPGLAHPRPEPLEPGTPHLRAAPPPPAALEAVPPAPRPASGLAPVPQPVDEAPPRPSVDGSAPPRPAPAETLPERAAREAAPDVAARVLVHLTNGERVEAGRFANVAAARVRAEEVVAELNEADGRWPFHGGRFLRPDAVVSVDLELVHA